ncbi:hypothetical protein ALP8811_00816 [Aliiroseovarius pelagivivens]|uniref:Uncharacterized protein n=1 Tax=Aliiroseovarius pelagivivens TaxID=1639690 RepID=A0A2R8AIE3_9RHOB|nr:hypothetical protein [Aliiroseovarius pelagivivens]SPF75822.1 hypothetical protein ALP8811_00816 [Aliiroseovarius pelagivivens]
MTSDLILKLVAEHGPWVLLVFYLLYRDLQKDQATRAVLDKNSSILIEITTIIRERLPAAGARR